MNKYSKILKRKLYIALNPYRYKHIVKTSKYMAHALGGIDEKSYTNSLEALENSYKNGFRLFETDLKIASDGLLILNHNGWQERMGFDPSLERIDSISFKNTKIYKKYSSLTFKDLKEFMKIHKDMYVMIDISKKSYDMTAKIYKKIIKEAKKDTSILQRLIVSGHTTEMMEAIQSLYDFKIKNLYCPEVDKRDEKLDTAKKIIEYCKRNKILSISLPNNYNNEDIIKLAKKNNIIIYLFTINNYEEAKKQLNKVDIIGTDFLKN